MKNWNKLYNQKLREWPWWMAKKFKNVYSFPIYMSQLWNIRYYWYTAEAFKNEITLKDPIDIGIPIKALITSVGGEKILNLNGFLSISFLSQSYLISNTGRSCDSPIGTEWLKIRRVFVRVYVHITHLIEMKDLRPAARLRMYYRHPFHIFFIRIILFFKFSTFKLIEQ